MPIIMLLIVSITLNLLALPALASDESNTACTHYAKEFLNKPSRASFGMLSSSFRDGCWSTLYTNVNLNKLISFTTAGNKWAAQYLVNHLQKLDGGNLEDSLISLGQFGDHCMECLLEFDKREKLSRSELSDALTMLPLSLSDKPDAQLKLLRLRRAKVDHVKRSDLTEQKNFALKAIDDFILEIKSKKQ